MCPRILFRILEREHQEVTPNGQWLIKSINVILPIMLLSP